MTALCYEVRADPMPLARPVVDIVVPVYNEAAVLGASITRLHTFLRVSFPFSWRITIVDNASTDGSWATARSLAAVLPRVHARRLEQKGRGLALRTAWQDSDAQVVAYMDVDLSTGLDALLPLVAPLVSGHSDIAIGSRLAAGAAVARGPKREFISRTYNLILRAVFGNGFRDAQCGFKAVRSDVARALLPKIVDNGWFFDTELLLLAEHNGLRVTEVAVDWVDDPDSRVDIARTATDDLRGVWRVLRRFARGEGRVDLGAVARPALADDMGRRLVSFASIGAMCTAGSLALFLLLRPGIGSMAANALALTATVAGNAWANRRFTLRHRGPTGRLRHYLIAAAIFGGGLVLSSGAMVVGRLVSDSLLAEVLALVVAWSATTIARFASFGAVAPGRQTPLELVR